MFIEGPRAFQVYVGKVVNPKATVILAAFMTRIHGQNGNDSVVDIYMSASKTLLPLNNFHSGDTLRPFQFGPNHLCQVGCGGLLENVGDSPLYRQSKP